jgi:hypothetical protein
VVLNPVLICRAETKVERCAVFLHLSHMDLISKQASLLIFFLFSYKIIISERHWSTYCAHCVQRHLDSVSSFTS